MLPTRSPCPRSFSFAKLSAAGGLMRDALAAAHDVAMLVVTRRSRTHTGSLEPGGSPVRPLTHLRGIDAFATH